MSLADSRFGQLFLEMQEGLPRQGPGSRASAARALSCCRELPDQPQVLDLGCGVGAQTLYLADLLKGPIQAIDNHAPFIQRLTETIQRYGYADRVQAKVGDMARLPFVPQSFDLIWSEGALYQIGLERALGICRELLKKGGYLAFTDAVWLKDDPPPELKAAFDSDYPTMGATRDVLRLIEDQAFLLIDHFPLPEEAWWNEYYAPMERRIAELRSAYADDQETQFLLDQLAEEPKMHRDHSIYYNYEFFICQRPV